MSSTADQTDLISEVEGHLRGVGKLVRRAMLDAMPDGEPVEWLYGPMREYPSRPGKALRPALCLSASRVFGAEPDAVMGIAVAIELLHNAFLVHDDIADGSEMRRGRPTLAATHGVAAALNAGDGLAIVAGQVLRKATRQQGDKATRRQGNKATRQQGNCPMISPTWFGTSSTRWPCARWRGRPSKPVGRSTMSRTLSPRTTSS